jgi:hypothetical protein
MSTVDELTEADYMPGTWEVFRGAPGGGTPEGYPARGTYVVYRLYDVDGELIYIGVSVDMERRFRGHADKPWVFASAREAADKVSAYGLEAFAILSEQPDLNEQLWTWSGPLMLAAAARRAGLLYPELEAFAEERHATIGAVAEYLKQNPWLPEADAGAPQR